jgi:exodeoxyribonuclease V alpha subunit
MKKITGTPSRMIFKSDNGYCCVSLSLTNGSTLNVSGVAGEYSQSLLNQFECPIDFYGEMITHPKFGDQFKFDYLCPSDSVEPAFYIGLLNIPYTKKAYIKEVLRDVEKFDDNAIALVKATVDMHYSDKMAVSVLKSIKQHIFWPLIVKKLLDSKATVDRLELEQAFMSAKPESLDDLISNPYRMCINNIIDFKTASLFAGENVGKGDDRQVAAIIHAVADICGKTGSSCVLLESVEKAILKLTGDHSIPDHDYINVFDSNGQDYIQTRRYEQTELSIANSISLIQQGKKSVDIDQQAIQKISHKYIQEPTSCQQSALDIIHNPISVITGLPGTGKTYLVNSIVKIIDELSQCEIMLIGPTGASAKRLEEMTGVESKTIHSALGYNPGTNKFLYDENNKLEIDWVGVDEGSMVDMFLFEKLLRAIPSSARIIIFGDVDQLPSILEGSILRDLFEVLPSVRMTTQKRFQSSGITDFCRGLCEGEILHNIDATDLTINIAPTESHLEKWVQASVQKIIAATNKAGINHVQILAPQYAGKAGIDSINEYCRSILFPNDEPFEVKVGKKAYYYHKGHKVIIKKNMPDKGLFNGDIGVIKHFAEIESKKNFLTISCKGRDVQLNRNEIRDMMPAYCISIHNSQGNEYTFALVIVTKSGANLLSRNLLNTAASRGKRKVVIVSEPGALEQCAKKTERNRLTKLQDQLIDKLEITNLHQKGKTHAF